MSQVDKEEKMCMCVSCGKIMKEGVFCRQCQEYACPSCGTPALKRGDLCKMWG